MPTKPEVIRMAASNIERGRTYNWHECNCCQIAHIVQVIEDITRAQMVVPFHSWHLALLNPFMQDNPHILSLKKAGFTNVDVASLELLGEHYGLVS